MRPNKWFFRERTRSMPRMQNLPPYETNEIVRWFANLYQCDIAQGQKLFERAKALSYGAAKADPEKWPPFLLFDSVTKEWHGSDVI